MKKILLILFTFIGVTSYCQLITNKGIVVDTTTLRAGAFGAKVDTSQVTKIVLTGTLNGDLIKYDLPNTRFINFTPNYWLTSGNAALSRTLNYAGSSDTSEYHIKQNGVDVITINGSQQVGIGTINPAYTLDVQKVGTGASAPIFNLFGYGTGTGTGGYLTLGGSAGTSIGSLAATPDSKAIGTIDFIGVNGSSARVTSARIQAIQKGTAGTSFNAARLGFFISTSVATIAEKMSIDTTGNVGIGTVSPNTLALLDISSTAKGVLLPRLTTAQMNAITSPPDGLLIYLTDSSSVFFYNLPATAWYNLRGLGASGTVITGGAQSFSGLKTFSTGIVAGTITTTATAATSNLAVSAGATVANATTTAQLKSSANNVMYRVAIRGSTSTTTTANTDVWALDVGDNNYTEPATGTAIESGGVFIATQSFVDGAGATTNFSNLRVGDAPTSTATNNWSILAGKSKFTGTVTLPSGIAIGAGDTTAMLAGYQTAVNTNATNITTNTTLATLANSVGFTIMCDPLRLAAPLDATTYFFGMTSGGATTVVNSNRMIIPVNCTLIGYTLSVRSSVTASNEPSTFYVRVNNTTDYQINNTAEFSGSGTVATYYSMALNNNYTAGDYFEIKWVTPAAGWVTNPTNAGTQVILYFKNR